MMDDNFVQNDNDSDQEQEISLGSNGSTSVVPGKRKNDEIVESGDSKRLKREYLCIKNDPIFPQVLMGTGPEGPNQLTTAILLFAILKYFNIEQPDLITYLVNEKFEMDINLSYQEQIRQIAADPEYRKYRELLADILHTIIGAFSSNKASNMVELLSLRGRFTALEQLAGAPHVNAIISFAQPERVNFRGKTFITLRDEMITSDTVEDFLRKRVDKTFASAFYKIVIPMKTDHGATTVPIDWTVPDFLGDHLPEQIKQPETCPVLYVSVTSKHGLCNAPSKPEQENQNKNFVFLESYLVAQFEVKKKIQTLSKVTIRKR